jgi:hypothetical protein
MWRANRIRPSRINTERCWISLRNKCLGLVECGYALRESSRGSAGLPLRGFWLNQSVREDLLR